jgi:hypothetical protein
MRDTPALSPWVGFPQIPISDLDSGHQRRQNVIGPDEDFRIDLAGRRYETEEDVVAVLNTVLERLGYQEDDPAEDDPYRELGAIEEWASLASYAVSRFYGPQSPLRTDIAGWSRGAVERLREIAEKLRPRLAWVAALLAAVSFSISVGFPWGVSIGVGF